MIIVRLRGGLGNQMFQYAYGKKLALENKTSLKLDLSWFSSAGAQKPKRTYDLDIFNIKPLIASKLETSFVKIFGKTFKEGEKTKTTQTKTMYVDGFWQNPNYLKGIEKELVSDFVFKAPLQTHSATLSAKICATTSVCVNVRRDDFVTDEKFVGAAYYEKAVNEILSRLPDACFFVFSDDMEWCRNNLKFIPRATFVGHEYAGYKFSDYLSLMRECSHFIIPSSTFGWWAAWLATNPTKIVIVPKDWPQGATAPTPDIIPKEWIQL